MIVPATENDYPAIIELWELSVRATHHFLPELLAGNKTITSIYLEHNPEAVKFYKRIGYRQVGGRELDSMGRPFPLLEMQS